MTPPPEATVEAVELLASYRPPEMTAETAPEWVSQLTPDEYAKRRNEENASALISLKVQGDWLNIAASMLHTAGAMSGSEYGSYGHSCLIVSNALAETREAILDALSRVTPGWLPIADAPTKTFHNEVMLASIWQPKDEDGEHDGPPQIAWAHVAYLTASGWQIGTGGFKGLHGFASFPLCEATHFMPLPAPPQHGEDVAPIVFDYSATDDKL